jgi:hypothetical protein
MKALLKEYASKKTKFTELTSTSYQVKALKNSRPVYKTIPAVSIKTYL